MDDNGRQWTTTDDDDERRQMTDDDGRQFTITFAAEHEEEVVNIKLLTKEEGGIHMQFTSHGKNHNLHLKESRVQLKQVPINFLGDVDHAEGVKLAKETTLMIDKDRVATMAIKRDPNGELEPVVHSGFFHLGDHEFEMTAHSTGKARITKRAIKEREFLNDGVVYGAQKQGKRFEVVNRTEPIIADVELAMLVDYSLYQKFQGHDRIRGAGSSTRFADLLLYFAHLASIMDTSYRTMQNDDITVWITLTGISVITSPFTYPGLVEDLKNNTGNITYVDGEEVLDKLELMRESLMNDSFVPPNDHLMLFSNYDLSADGSDGLLGVAFTSQICQNGSVSVVEVIHPQAYVAMTASHELAHSLGVSHDGSTESANCSDSDYIMAAYAGGDGNPFKKFQFSCCSQRSMYFYLSQPSAQCLTVHDAEIYGDEEITNSTSNYLPGQVFDADDQCYIAYGTSACNPSVYQDNNSSICLELYCVNPDDAMTCILSGNTATDGTRCDSEKVCYQSSCVNKTDAQLQAAQNCNVKDCYGSEMKCETGLNAVEPGLGQCYPKNWKCDGEADCEDGSDEICPPCEDKSLLKKKCNQIMVKCQQAETKEEKEKCKQFCEESKEECCETCCKRLGMC
ncbi:A disintegrin and metalloproteinase with thrombospondin motifs 13-like [Watersipora subatra]|uniref:A disintegrin and metalloproteinase with thrombospondin motifs 13-like n=1 Tax=Watersipora subatra TaxID=2589382 RepID=UPI00355B945E